jgi:hypothetical protein
MLRRLAVVVFTAVLFPFPQAQAQDYVDYVRDWMVMGPSSNGGQRETDATQYHTEGYTQCFNTHPDWCNDLTPGVKVRGGFQKSYLMNPTSATWLSSGVPGCVPYVQALKGSDGLFAEFGCIVNQKMNLIWEVLSASTVRKFFQASGSSWQTGITWGLESSQSVGGPYAQNFSSRVDVYGCSGGNPSGPTSSSSPKGGYTWYIFNITTDLWRQSSLSDMRQLGLVPASQSDSEVLPSVWHSTFLQQVGRSGQNVYLMVKKDYLDLYCGSTDCANYVETYWYLAASPYFVEYGPINPSIFSFGLVRWNVQSLSAGKFYREGVQDTLVQETGSGRTLARQICH